MSKKEIAEFVSESIEQIKSAISEELSLGGTFDFDISVITRKGTKGKIGINLAGIDHSRDSQQVHRIKFSITDKKSREENVQYASRMIRELMSEFSKLDQLK